MHQKLSSIDFDESFFEAVGVAVFEQPIEFRFFQRVVGVNSEDVFWAKVAQSCVGGCIVHKKASRVV